MILPNHDYAVLNQHPDKLFNVEWVALGPLNDQVAQFTGDATRFLQDLAHQSPAGPPREGLEIDLGVALLSLTPTGTALEQRRARQTDDQQPPVRNRPHQLVEQV